MPTVLTSAGVPTVGDARPEMMVWTKLGRERRNSTPTRQRGKTQPQVNDHQISNTLVIRRQAQSLRSALRLGFVV